MKKILLALIVCSSVACAAAAGLHYRFAPDSSYVDNVHYDAELNVIVVHVHARAWFIKIDPIYGIKVKNNVDIEKKMKDIMGDNPEVVRLEIDNDSKR